MTDTYDYKKLMDELSEIYKTTYNQVAYCADYVWGKSRNILQPLWSIKWNASKITSNIYISDLASSFNRTKLKEAGITHILNLVVGIDPPFPEDFVYMNVPVRDVPDQDLYQYFDACYRFMADCHINGGKVLVHCSYGVSRSATIVLAYLVKIKYLDMSFDDICTYVKCARPMVAPNSGFMTQLVEYSKRQEEQGT